MLGNLSGTIINYSDIARALGVSQPTARDYMQIAHGTFIWRNIPPYEKNATKRIVKHPKGYLRDSGLLHFLLHLNKPDELLVHPKMGHSWKAMVIETLLREFNAQGITYNYYHYRTGGGAEIDLILDGEFGILPIEIKYSQKVSMKQLRGIRDFVREHNCQYGIVINNAERITLYDEKLIGIPFGCL
jgi:predicted AAA+ superfamily ATPase